MVVSAIMAEIANHAENQPWPSLDWASWIFDRASFVLVGSLVIGAGATIAMVWMGIVKEHHWDLAREHASERIASLGLETAKANEGAAQANAKAAEANQKAEEERLARVKLEAHVAPRRITQEQQNELTERLKHFQIRETTLMASPSTSENEWTVRWLGAPLAAAGWNIKILPSTSMASMLFPRGIAVFGPWLPDGEPYDPDKEQTGVLAPADRLARSLREFGIEATALPMIDVQPGCIRIIVNSR